MAAASGTAAPGPFAPPLRLCPIRVCAGLGRSFDSLQPTPLTPKLPEPNPITGRLASPPCSIENEIAPDHKVADLERRFPLWPPPREDPCPGSARPAFASLRSAVSKPSVNQPEISASITRASSRQPCLASSRARLVVARSSNDFASVAARVRSHFGSTSQPPRHSPRTASIASCL